ncbi:MAG: protein kinase domain-containing protein, partial [Planctomycetota bacterium]
MEADRFERVGALFDLARELQGDERARLLDERCEGDADLRAEVESLLAHHAVAASQLDEPLLTPAVEPPPLHSVGPYRLVRRIGAGGMGTVFEAEQTNPDRSIALKLMSPALSSPEMLRRFDQEVQLLGRLEHPCIARIFDAGSAETIHGPQPYFAMELIAGVDLLTYAADRHLDVAARVALIRRVCEAVHHAHLRGVVHRDLKPANILVDETGNPKILDFGIARAIEADPATRTRLTMTGELVGTVPYMSPEQFTGRTEDIDLRSDVYGLGVVLYELLTGRLPYDFGDVMPHEAVRIVRDGEPRRMSAVHRELRGDIQTIVDKAIAKEPERRYGSAADLSADLGRWLDDEPILARPATTIYQLRKFVRRNRGSLSAATVFVVLLSIFAVAMFFKARENRRLADSEGLAKRDALEALADADTQRDRADATAERLARELRASNIQRGRLLARDGQPISAVQIVWREHLQDPASAHSLWALREIAARHGLLQTHIAHEGSSVTSIAFASRAARLVSSGADGRICLLDSARHASAGYMEMNADVHVLAAHPDGTTVAAGTNAGAIAIIDARSARIVRTLEGEEAVRALAYSGDGFHLAAAGATGTVHLLEASTGMPLGTFDLGTRVVSLCFSPDGASIAAACADATVRLLRPGVSPQVLRAPSPAVHVVFTHDGSHVYAGHEDGRIRAWVTGSGQRLLDTTTGNVNITAMALSTDSRTLVTGGLYSIDVWSTSPLELKRSLPVHRRVEGLAISVRGDFVAAGTIDGTVRVWDLTSKSSEIL